MLLINKVILQHMLNEKQGIFNIYLLLTKMQLKIISLSLNSVNDALIVYILWIEQKKFGILPELCVLNMELNFY